MKPLNKALRGPWCIGIAIGALLSSCTPPGMKLLTLEVRHEGDVVLRTIFDVPDSSTTSEIWDATGREPFSTETAATSVSASEADPLKAKLTGAVEIRIRHGTWAVTRAALTDLTLSRSSPATADWHLPAAEVRRAKKSAGP